MTMVITVSFSEYQESLFRRVTGVTMPVAGRTFRVTGELIQNMGVYGAADRDFLTVTRATYRAADDDCGQVEGYYYLTCRRATTPEINRCVQALKAEKARRDAANTPLQAIRSEV